MSKRRSALLIEDDDNKRQRILRDGERLRVSMVMMDGLDDVQRGIARRALRASVGHRPGPGLTVDAAPDAERIKALADYERRICDAWRGRDAIDPNDDPDNDDDNDNGNNGDDDFANDAERARNQLKVNLTNAWRGPGPGNVGANLNYVGPQPPPTSDGSSDPRIAALRDCERRLQDAWRRK
jgi:hypothetical protein